ncbi:MAG: lipoyl protein ligase domain-containing protein [Microthrixaceae bacterium]
MSWSVEHRRGGAEELHHQDVPDTTRTMIVAEIDRPALVLGSTQADSVADVAALARTGVALARRRSGGGVVLLVPGEHVWVDLVVPAGDPLWHDDVGRAMWWVGESWAHALEAAGITDVEVHRGGVTHRELARRACFAGLGPGEVTVDGRKLVGISQRRTRTHARFQCVLHRQFRADRTIELLAPDLRGPELSVVLHDEVASLDGLGVTGWSVVEHLRAQLP